MKTALFFCFAFVVLSSFSSHVKLTDKKSNSETCATQLYVSCRTSSTQWVIQKITFISASSQNVTVEYNTNISYNSCPTPNVYGSTGAVVYDVSIQLYEEIDAPTSSGYLVLKDNAGNVLDCKQIQFGMHTYTFHNIIGYCYTYHLSVSPTCS